ncbi:hypothetical protein Tco_1052286 [Tanacetum coccineum]
MSNRHQELTSPEQTASALAISWQTATGKESSNPLTANSLPKTIQSNNPPLSRGYTLGSVEDSLKLMELMEFVQNCVTCFTTSTTWWHTWRNQRAVEFHQIIDFLTASHIHYALTENPTIYASCIKQFWTTATSSTNVTREVELTASIDGQAKTITEASLRRHLKLKDNSGITSLPNTEIFEQLALMGYATDSDKLTFQKGNFSTQWRFFIHTILHYLSPKKTSWEQFSSNIATAIICLATNRTFNFSKFIFDVMGYSGEDIPLFPSMITAPETSPSRITSSPSLSPQHTPVSAPSTSPPPILETTPTIKEPAPMPHESPLQSVQSLRRDEGSEKASDEIEVLLEEEATEIVQDHRSGEKGEQEVTTADTALNTANVPISIASETPEVSTTAESLVYIRRSAKKKKDKGKSIIIEDEFVQKKSKKQVEEERLGHEEAIRLQEHIDEEERKRIARDAKIAKQLQEEYDKARKKEAITEVDTAHDIDWNDPSVIRYYVILEYRQSRQSHRGLTNDKEKELWVELKMLFKPDEENLLELQKYMHHPLKGCLYDMCAVYHVSTEKGQDIFMLVEKDYPLTRGLATLMLCNKLRVDQPLEMAYELLIKIYNIANRPRQGGLLGFKMILLVQDNTVIEALRI